MLRSASPTLTKLCLDWMLSSPFEWLDTERTEEASASLDLYVDLFKLRFPNLISFQYRNAVSPHTLLPEKMYLLERAGHDFDPVDINGLLPSLIRSRLGTLCLEFVEAHLNLQCLAWPMEN